MTTTMKMMMTTMNRDGSVRASAAVLVLVGVLLLLCSCCSLVLTTQAFTPSPTSISKDYNNRCCFTSRSPRTSASMSNDSSNASNNLSLDNEMYAESKSKSTLSSDMNMMNENVNVPLPPKIARPAEQDDEETVASSSSSSSPEQQRILNVLQKENEILKQQLKTLEKGDDNDTTTHPRPPSMARPDTNNELFFLDRDDEEEDLEDDDDIDDEYDDDDDDNEMALPSLSVWERNQVKVIQGGSRRTWSLSTASSEAIDMVQVHIKTEGRPMNANIDLWSGPDNTPQKISVYSEDGQQRPFRAFVATPHHQNSVSIRNTNTMEYPLQAVLEAGHGPGAAAMNQARMTQLVHTKPKHVQGSGTVITQRFDHDVHSVQILLHSEGRPLQCRIELLSGPNTVKQVMEVYTEEGSTRPFYAIVETPGNTNAVIRIVNSGTLEFPFDATILPWETGDDRGSNSNEANENAVALLGGGGSRRNTNKTNNNNPLFVIDEYGGNAGRRGQPRPTLGKSATGEGGASIPLFPRTRNVNKNKNNKHNDTSKKGKTSSKSRRNKAKTKTKKIETNKGDNTSSSSSPPVPPPSSVKKENAGTRTERRKINANAFLDTSFF